MTCINPRKVKILASTVKKFSPQGMLKPSQITILFITFTNTSNPAERLKHKLPVQSSAPTQGRLLNIVKSQDWFVGVFFSLLLLYQKDSGKYLQSFISNTSFRSIPSKTLVVVCWSNCQKVYIPLAVSSRYGSSRK